MSSETLLANFDSSSAVHVIDDTIEDLASCSQGVDVLPLVLMIQLKLGDHYARIVDRERCTGPSTTPGTDRGRAGEEKFGGAGI